MGDGYKHTHERNEGQVEPAVSRYGKRHSLMLLLFFGCSCLYIMRVNLSVAIVAMVKPHHKEIKEESFHDASDQCPQEIVPAYEHTSLRVESENGNIDWDEHTQGIILGGFFYGYLLTNFLGGRLADRFGGRLVYGSGVTLTAFLTLLSPWAARHSTNAFLFLRVLEGMTEGVTFPALHEMLSHWIPPQERAGSVSRIIGGVHFGTVVVMSISGWLTETKWGWPIIFYLSGFLSLVWSWLWFRLAYNTPEDHPTISVAEKNFIKQGIGHHRGKMGQKVPWRSILTSVPFIALAISHVCHNWGFYCLLTELPTYLRNIQHFDMKQNGFVSALPYLMLWIFSLTYSSYMDYLLRKKKLSTKQIRILSMSIASFVPAASLLLVRWAGCDAQLVVILICIAVGSSGAALSGFLCGFQELAPNFAGTLTGISNTLATIPGFLAPAVTGNIVNNKQTLSGWREVFNLASLVYIVGGIVYVIFISADTQPWNSINDSKRKEQMRESDQLKSV